MAILKVCCCGYSLQSGALILGWLHVLGSVPSIYQGYNSMILYDNNEALLNKLRELHPDKKTILDVLIAPKLMIITLLPISIIAFFGAISLIIGALHRKKLFVGFYLLSQVLSLLVMLIFMIYYLYVLFSAGTVVAYVFLIGFVTLYASSVYLFLCVVAFYQELGEVDFTTKQNDKDGEEPYTNNDLES